MKDNYLRNISDYKETDELCLCWNEPTFKSSTRFKLSWKISRLNILGLGFPLYFQLKWFIIILFSILIFFLTIPSCLLTLSEGGRMDSTNRIMKSLTVGTYDLRELHESPNKILPQLILNSWAIILIGISVIIFRCFQNKMIKDCSKDYCFPESYTVMASNIPKNATPIQVKEAFRKV